MNPYLKIWHRFVYDMKHMMGDFQVWLSRLDEGEKLLGLCLFIMVLLLFVMRRPASPGSSEGAMGRQFSMALVVVVIFSFGIGWLIDERTMPILHLLD